MTQMKFGRQLHEQPAFEINGLMFGGLPLSLAEERALAVAGEGESEADMMDAVLEVLAQLLNARARGEGVNAAWLTENLAPADVEGILEYLRSGAVVPG